MTDRLHSLTVVLETDMRSDDVQYLMSAIRQLRGVADVSGHVTDMNAHIAQVRVRQELGEKLFAVLHPGVVK